MHTMKKMTQMTGTACSQKYQFFTWSWTAYTCAGTYHPI